MSKEKEIEEMAKAIDNVIYQYSSDPYTPPESHLSECIAHDLIMRGYGNIKQAVKEFADKAIEIIAEVFVENLNRRDFIHKLSDKLENLIKPYGADE